MSEYVIKFGNHWLQTDAFRTKEEWVTDAAMASTHPQEWADQYVAEHLEKRNQVMYQMTFGTAIGECRATLKERLKTAWITKFYDTVVGNYENAHAKSEGIWANAHMYYAMNIRVGEAVKRFVTEFQLARKKKK